LAYQERILIVDDDFQTASYIAELLSAQGYQTAWAFDGEEALAKLQGTSPQAAGIESPFDLVVLDVMIPGIDGYEVCRRVKNDSQLRHISVVMVTGLGSTTNKTKGLELGADDYVPKPFTPAELLARVKATLRVRAAEREVVQRNRELAALNNISRLTSRSLDLDEVLATTLNETMALMGGRAAFIALRQEEEPERPDRPDEIVLRSHRGLPSQLNGQFDKARWTLGQGLVGAVAQSGRTQIVHDLESDPHLKALSAHGFSALVCAPLTTQREVVGTLAILGRRQDQWAEHSLHLLEAVGSQVGVAIDNARLYTRVHNYAEQLARSQAQLVQAEKLAAMGRLTASIAHEINNPLQGVQNCLHLILHRNLNPNKQQQYLTMAEDEVKRLIDTVQGMLDFYRPSPNQHHVTDIHQAIEDVLALANKRIERGRVRIVRAYDPNLPLINAAANQLKQVFLNLVINAVEAMPKGGELSIHTHVDPDQGWLSITFQDQGIGLSRQARLHLFEPFYTTKTKGTGLGLSISFGIVEQHGGTIEVESQRGQGSRFTVKLPQSRAVSDRQKADAPARARSSVREGL
jgi:signal transduction histidine kinase/ActR/RegA family two-component response regulator